MSNTYQLKCVANLHHLNQPQNYKERVTGKMYQIKPFAIFFYCKLKETYLKTLFLQAFNFKEQFFKFYRNFYFEKPTATESMPRAVAMAN